MAKVELIMGSQSDWPTMKQATLPLQELQVEFNAQVVSAHRTPKRLYDFAHAAEENGVQVIIAGAGGAAHLPGMAAAMTWIPVVGVPVKSSNLSGLDSLLSIVQMPKGVAVATQAIGSSGAYNAGLIAAQILALSDADLRERLKKWREAQTQSIPWEVE